MQETAQLADHLNMLNTMLTAALLASAISAQEPARYALRYDAAARTMQVELCLAAAAPTVHFAGDGSAPRSVEALTRADGAPVQRDGNGWSARDWRAGECLHYRADLGRISDAQARRNTIRVRETLTDPASWLLMADTTDSAEARVELPPGIAISAPWQPLPSSGNTHRFRIVRTPTDWLGRVAIGTLAEQTLTLPGGRLHVALGDGVEPAQRDKLLAWLQRVGRAAASAYGRLPLADVQVLVIPVGAQREAVVFGQSTRGQGNGVTLFVDAQQSATAFDRDWVAVHELSHLFHPHLGDRGAWLAEGLATYYQDVLRARAGLLTPEQGWDALHDGFTRGASGMHGESPRDLESAANSMGEDHEFLRVYWSGTAYWLDVDIELRHASANRMNLDEALQRFSACCLPGTRDWTPEEFVAKLDALSGSTVFTRRFRDYRALRTFPDIAALDARLERDADVRRAIMQAVPRAESSSATQ